jgi:hypothetical protein
MRCVIVRTVMEVDRTVTTPWLLDGGFARAVTCRLDLL